MLYSPSNCSWYCHLNNMRRRIILKCILKKYIVKMRAGNNCLRIGPSTEFFLIEGRRIFWPSEWMSVSGDELASVAMSVYLAKWLTAARHKTHTRKARKHPVLWVAAAASERWEGPRSVAAPFVKPYNSLVLIRPVLPRHAFCRNTAHLNGSLHREK